ncbi:MAG: ArgE/DapE family deacylase, partial [Chloroflexi bacterium]|nr:ArgE/DapE family deacylase [Chloroflexota bacterium]
MNEAEKELLQDIEQREDELFDLVRTLVRFETPNPPGGNEKEAQEWTARRLREMGMEVDVFDVYPGRPDVVGVLKGTGGGRSVILNGHIDVAEVALRDQWTHDPYDPVVVGRKMYGRGAADMKSGLAGYLFALESLIRHGFKLKGDVLYESAVGEEAGEAGTREMVKRGYKADFAIVAECSLGRNIHPSVGVMNACVTVRSPYSLHLVHRKNFVHAGGQMEGANAIEKMATKIIPALNELEREWAVFKTHPLLPPGLPVINPFAIEGGGNTFILPHECKLYVTVYYLPNEKKEDVQGQVEDQVRRAAELDSWLRKYPPTVEWNPERSPIEFVPADFDPESAGVILLP